MGVSVSPQHGKLLEIEHLALALLGHSVLPLSGHVIFMQGQFLWQQTCTTLVLVPCLSE